MYTGRTLIALLLLATLTACARKSPPETPDAAVEHVCHAMADNQPQVAFAALPESYQADVNLLVTEFATRVDEDVWNGCMRVLRRIAVIFGEKGELIAASRYLADDEQKQLVQQNWKRFAETLAVILDSDFADLKKLREGDVRGLLAGSGQDVMEQLRRIEADSGDLKAALAVARQLHTAAADLVSQDGETAVVTLRIDGQAPQTLTMVRVEGQWISQALADTFKQMMADLLTGVRQIDFTSEQGLKRKAVMLGQISTIDTLLAQAETAQTPEQMDGVINGMVIGVYGAILGSMMTP